MPEAKVELDRDGGLKRVRKVAYGPEVLADETTLPLGPFAQGGGLAQS
jgi:hypothetical protein